MSLAELIEECRELAISKNYSSSTYKTMDKDWTDLMEFASINNEKKYSEHLCDMFLDFKLGNYEFSKLSPRKKRLTRNIGILKSYAMNGDFEYRVRTYVARYENDEIGDTIKEFIAFKESEGLCLSTIQEYERQLIRLNHFLYNIGIHSPSDITMKHIYSFFEERALRNFNLKNLLTFVKKFLRWLYESEKIKDDMSKYIKPSASNRKRSLPTTYTKEEILTMLKAVDRSSAKGKRDYAMLLLCTHLGLRSGDIVSLKFTNLDWEKNQISIYQSKTGDLVTFPLLSDIGNAIIDYLQYGRPQKESEFVFLSHCTNVKELKTPTLHSIVTEYLRKAQIKDFMKRKHGPHALRHSLASELLKKDVSLPIISTILGHQSSETTKVYLTIDAHSLRELTLPMPVMLSPLYQ